MDSSSHSRSVRSNGERREGKDGSDIAPYQAWAQEILKFQDIFQDIRTTYLHSNNVTD